MLFAIGMLFLPVTHTDNTRATGCPEPDFSVFDDGHGFLVPPIDPYLNSPNFGIRSAVLTY